MGNLDYAILQRGLDVLRSVKLLRQRSMALRFADLCLKRGVKRKVDSFDGRSWERKDYREWISFYEQEIANMEGRLQ
jgi:hypothetical protein